MRVVNDRRTLPRATQGGGVTLESRRGTYVGTCLDVSAGGMAVLVPIAAKGKEQFSIHAQLWGFPLLTKGIVVRCRPMLGVWFWGLRFLRLDGATKARLESFVQQQLVYSARVRQAELFTSRLRGATRRPSEEAQRRVQEFAPIPMLDDRAASVSGGSTVGATFDDEWTREYAPQLATTDVQPPVANDRAAPVHTLRVMVVPPNRARED